MLHRPQRDLASESGVNIRRLVESGINHIRNGPKRNQLNATVTPAGATGSFVYTPGAGTVLNAGSQMLSVAFIRAALTTPVRMAALRCK